MSVYPNSHDQAGSAKANPQRYDGEPKSLMTHLLEAVLEQVAEPRQDVEQNLKSALSAVFKRYDLVTQAEFEQQQHQLKKAQALLEELSTKLDELSGV